MLVTQFRPTALGSPPASSPRTSTPRITATASSSSPTAPAPAPPPRPPPAQASSPPQQEASPQPQPQPVVVRTRPLEYTGGRLKCYHCDYPGCEKSYARPVRLEEHKRTHTGERPFKCVTCLNDFARESHLQAHLRTHKSESEKTCICTTCGAKFWTNQHLKAHNETIHNGKTYDCTQCDQKYRKRNHLRIHIAEAHCEPGTQPYPCPQEGCTKSFKQSAHLRLHFKTHDPTRYQCAHATCLLLPLAQRQFHTWSALVKHTKTVHPPTCHHPGKCFGKTFTTRRGLRNHLTKIHEEKGDGVDEEREEEGLSVVQELKKKTKFVSLGGGDGVEGDEEGEGEEALDEETVKWRRTMRELEKQKGKKSVNGQENGSGRKRKETGSVGLSRKEMEMESEKVGGASALEKRRKQGKGRARRGDDESDVEMSEEDEDDELEFDEGDETDEERDQLDESEEEEDEMDDEGEEEDGSRQKKRRVMLEPDSPWHCDEPGCSKKFKSQEALISHTTSHTLPSRPRRKQTPTKRFNLNPLPPKNPLIDVLTGANYSTPTSNRHFACPFPKILVLGLPRIDPVEEDDDPAVVGGVGGGAGGGSGGGGRCEYRFSRVYDVERHLEARHGVLIGREALGEWLEDEREREEEKREREEEKRKEMEVEMERDGVDEDEEVAELLVR